MSVLILPLNGRLMRTPWRRLVPGGAMRRPGEGPSSQRRETRRAVRRPVTSIAAIVATLATTRSLGDDDGFEVCAALTQAHPDVSVVLACRRRLRTVPRSGASHRGSG